MTETTVDHERSATRETVGDSGSLLARPAAILRIEGATLLAASVMLYWANGGSWWLFALLLLAPDLSALGYLAGPRIGAAAYNAFHSFPLPAALGLLGMLWGMHLVVGIALVWFAHIGMDRLVGYGLKYPSGFKNTHLGRV
jgi:hypothetical protein